MMTSDALHAQPNLSDDDVWGLEDARSNRASVAAATLIGAFFQPIWILLDVYVMPDTWWAFVPGRVIFSAFCVAFWLNMERLDGDRLRVGILSTFWLGAAALGVTVPWSGDAYGLYMVSYSLLLWAGGSTLALAKPWATGFFSVILLLVPCTHWAMGTDQDTATLLWTYLYLLTASLLCWTAMVNRYRGQRQTFDAGRALLARTQELASSRLDVLEERTVRVAQQAFLQRMSHELRTPLNAVLGFTEMARESTADAGLDEATEDLEKAAKAGHHLLGLLSDILDLSAIESGQVPFEPQRIDVGAVVVQVVETARAAATNKGLALEVTSSPLHTHHDPTRVTQVVVALVSNAIRFTERGRVRVEVAATTGGAHVVVRDTGVGIQAPALQRVFQPFEQGDNSSTRSQGGAGLGLAVARGLARRMGGDITATSILGEGSSFCFTFPLCHPTDLGQVATQPSVT